MNESVHENEWYQWQGLEIPYSEGKEKRKYACQKFI
jgi:hypothetical protein